MKKNKISRRKIITISSIVIAISAIIFVSLFFVFNSINKKPTNDRVLVDYKSYNGDQAYISKSNVPSSENYKSISSIKDSDVSSATADFDYSSNILTISTAEELYRFSYLCSLNTKFLDYNYELLCNIDFDDYKVNDFIPIGWKNDAPFTGSFEGNGYEIKNLEMINITSANVNTYSNMKYFAMFSSVASNSKVLNFGLVDPIITIAAISEEIVNNGGVSYVVGSNAGIVENVFVKCLSTTLLDECGITAAGGYRIAGLCVNNSGTIKNSYLATNSLYNYTLTDVIEFADIALNNSGTIENCYFYNTSIDSTSTQTTNGAYNLIYVSDLGGMTKSGTTYYGTMVKSIDDLNSTFKELGWTIKTSLTDDKNEISDYYSNETPIHRGFKNTAVFSDGVYTIKITDVADFLFMFEAMNENNYFASNAIIYELISDLNLSGIPAKAYSYKSGFGASFVGDEKNDGSVTFINGSKNNYTIYNVDIANPERKHTVSGVDAYGLFPYLIGSVSKINIVTNVNLSTVEESNNVKAIGAVCGYSEGGIIDNVNVQFNVTLDSTTNIGEYYLGGVAGILGGEGGISNSTTTGSFELAKNTNYTSNTSYMGGIAVGGVVGYIEDSLGYVDTCLNNINITTGLGSSNAIYAVGGVIGAGYTTSKGDKKSQQLENLGTITIADVTSSGTGTTYDETVYSVLYAAGVIGRYLGQTEQIQMLVNQGNVLLYGSSDNKLTMLAGVMNADVKSQLVNNTNISPSQFKNKNGNTLFYASSLTNRADVQVLTTTNNLVYTSVLNVVSSNGIKSNISNIYNLNNNNVYGNSNKRSINKLNDFDIDLSNAETYAACLNSIGSTEVNNVEVDTIYNLRNINYTNTKEITSGNTLKYSAVALGDNISIKSGKNEGNITFLKAKTSGTTTTTFPNITASIISVGIIDNVGANSTLYDIYNGGNMTLDSDVTITGNVYFSGICYSNNHKYTQTELNKFNPLSDSYDSTAVGAIDNVINKGDILVTNSKYKEITYTAQAILGGAAKNTIAGTSYNETNTPSKYIVGNINITGISYINKSVINNTFNLSNLSGYNYVNNETNEINVGGISALNIGGQSYILNTANNGNIKAINLSKIKAKVNSSGISIRNDKNIDNSNYAGNNSHSKQMISFTINYGSVFSYSNGGNINSSSDEPSSKASGILSMGLCNVINTVNYGNIYGSESAAGIFGVVYFSNFQDEVNSNNKVNIANSINYGNVYQIDKGTNLYNDNTSFIPSYADFLALDDSNVNNKIEKSYSNVPISKDISGTITYKDISGIANFAKKDIVLTSGREYWTGSIFSLVNFNESANASNVNIRYLISFDKDLPIEGNETGYESAAGSTDVSKIYSSYYKLDGSTHTFSTYMGKNVTYSPLTTTTETVDTKTYIGIFNKNFDFRKAIEGDSTVIDKTVASDNLLSDFFQFVIYNKINDYLLDKIGWRSMAYDNAATLFATSLSNVHLYYQTYQGINSDKYKEDIVNSLNTANWTYNSSTEILNELIEILTDKKDEEGLINIINYIFSDSCTNKIIVDNSFRETMVNYLCDKGYSSLFNNQLLEFSQGYAEILADVLTNGSSELQEELSSKIDDYIKELDGSSKSSIINAYVTYLSSENGEKFFLSTNKYTRYEMLSDVIGNIDSEKFYETLLSVFSDDNQNIINNISEENIDIYKNFIALDSTSKKNLFDDIIKYTDESDIVNYLKSAKDDINLYSTINNKYSNYNIKSFDDIFLSTGNKYIGIKGASDTTTVNNRVDLWNKLRTTTTFTNYLKTKITDTFIDKATEHKNTMMSNTGSDVKNGVSGGNANFSAISEKSINSNTIFFGPYIDTKGTLIDDTIKSATTWTVSPTSVGNMSNKNSSSSMNNLSAEDYSGSNYGIDKITNTTFSTDGVTGQKYATTYLSVFMTTDEELAQSYYNNGWIYNYGVFGYSFGTKRYNGNSSSNEFVAFEEFTNDSTNKSITGNDKAALQLLTKKAVLNQTQNGSTTEIEIDLKQGAYITEYYSGKAKIYDGTNTIEYSVTADNYLKFVKENALKYYIALPKDTTIFPNYRTGIYLYQQPWVVNYIMPAHENYISNYIEYSVEDLLNIDGICSSEKNASTEYERDIINRIFNDYLISDENFSNIVKKSMFESIGTNNDGSTNYTLINNIVLTGVDLTIEDQNALKYLNYSTNQSVYDFLSSTTSTTEEEYKNKILKAAATNKDVFCELMSIMFDKTLVFGAVEDWSPTNQGTRGWGSSVDMYNLYSRVKTIYDARGKSFTAFNATGFEKTEASDYSNGYQLKGNNFYMPLRTTNTISTDYYSDNDSEITDPDNNPGYITGIGSGGSKVEFVHIPVADALSNNDGQNGTGITYDGTTITDIKMWTKRNSNSNASDCLLADNVYGLTPDSDYTDIRLPSEKYNQVKTKIINQINSNNGFIYGLTFTGDKADGNQNIVIPEASIYGKTYTNYVIPQRSISFEAESDGYICLAGLAYGQDWSNLFNVYSYTVNSTSLTTLSKFENVYAKTAKENGDIDITVNPTSDKDLSNYSLYYSSSWGQLPKGRLFYYEIPIKSGTHYIISNHDNGKCLKLLYLDLGQNGNNELVKTDKTYYIQDKLGVDDETFASKKNNIISYLTPLDGHEYIQATTYDKDKIYYIRTGSGTNTNPYSYSITDDVNENNYSNYYIDTGKYKLYIPASEYSLNKIYYQRNGTGKSSDPYVYSQVASGTVTADNYGYYYEAINYTIEDYQKLAFNDDFIRSLSKYSNKLIIIAIGKTNIDGDQSDLYTDILKQMVTKTSLLFDSIIDYEKEFNSLNDESSFTEWLVSGYLATDYYHHLNLNLSLGDTILAKELSDISNKETDYVTNSGNCEYIDENGNIIPEYFENFKLAIGLNYVDDGYGIFALASGKGIQNGTFIPDNLDLSSMDPYYNILAKDESGNATFEGNSIISLTDDVKNTSWRDLTGKSTDTNYDVSKEDSVNYAFKTEMKQLKKSISTTIFELDLSYSKDVILYAGTNEITSNTITYYLPKTYIEILKENSSVAINYRIADSASLLTNNSNDVSINFNGVEGPDSNGIYILSNAVTVTAEDTSVVQNYDIVLVPTSVDFEITGYTTDYTDNTKLNYNGGKVTLNIKTTNMPNGFNFSKYLTITNNGTNCDQWEIDNATINNGVVEDGNCRLVIDVKSSMPGGILTFTLSAFGTSSSKEIEKIQNTEAIIKNFEYEGEDRVVEFVERGEGTDLYYELTSTILFGRAYNYSELTNYSSSDFYLYNFAYSDNAEVDISAVKELDDGLMKYTITYTITSENGETKNIYKHILKEKAFDVDSIFANVYKDGISQDDSDLYKNSFADGNAQLNNNDKSSLKYRKGINFIALSFNRGVSPEYRIKYNLANFYTLDGVDYSYSVNDNAQNTSITESYRGLTVSVSDEFAPGIYKYEYTYSRSGNWSDGEYTRKYTFPAIYIVKLLSTDALLNRLTFIDSSIMLGNTATVMVPTKSIVVASPSTDEYTYSDLFKLENRDIEIKGRSITYNNNSNAINISDYYAIGTVSDSDLSYYCPTFGIEEHAQIYQYTTLNKLKNYGENQTNSDSKILSDHSSRLLYVPFVSNNEIYVFLVLIDDNTGKWKAVYDTDFNGDTDDKYKNSIYQYTNAFSTLEATQSDAAKFTYNGKEYTIAESCGKVNENQSLYMDYIGNPREDHFWFVSYMVFSESALNGDFSEGNVRYYHISIIDATNTVYFDVVLYAPESLNLESLYMTISENIYNAVGDKSSAQISGYLVRTDEKNASGYIKYELKIKLQTLPKGYFYFYIDLPQGYKVKVRTDMANQLDTATTPGSNEGGSFLPFTSIVPKTIKLEFIVDQGDNAGNGSWGITTTDIISVKATYDGYYDKSGNLYDKDGNLITSSSN